MSSNLVVAMPFVCLAVVSLFLMNVFNHGQHAFFAESHITDSLGLFVFWSGLVLELVLLQFLTSCHQCVPFVDCSRTTKIHCVWAWPHVIHVVPTLVSTSMLSWYGLIALVSECGAISCDTKTLVSFVVLIVSALHDWLSLPKTFTHVSHLLPFSISLFSFLGNILLMPSCKRTTCQLSTPH